MSQPMPPCMDHGSVGGRLTAHGRRAGWMLCSAARSSACSCGFTPRKKRTPALPSKPWFSTMGRGWSSSASRRDRLAHAPDARPGRAATLWTSGVFDRLPPVVDHATLAAASEDDGWVLVMCDVGEAIVGWDRVLTREERRQLLSATAAMHAAFAGERIPGLCPAIDWMTFMTPPIMEPWRGDPDRLPDWALRGWEAYFEAAPADVAGAVAAIHADPAPLAAQLECCEPTLVHGDLSGDNFGLFPDRVVVLDWGAANERPGRARSHGVPGQLPLARRPGPGRGHRRRPRRRRGAP